MKTALLIFSLVFSFNLFAEIFTPVKDKIIDLRVMVPEVFGKPVKGEVRVLHEENFSRVEDNDVHHKILEFIYAENGKEQDGIDPAVGEGVFIPKEQLGGICDTDLLKATFVKPYNQSQIDNYPVFLKFRASLFYRVFKRVKIDVRKPLNSLVWKVYYGTLEVNGLDLAINALGKVLKLDLLFNGKVVKSLRLEELETIPESEF